MKKVLTPAVVPGWWFWGAVGVSGLMWGGIGYIASWVW